MKRISIIILIVSFFLMVLGPGCAGGKKVVKPETESRTNVQLDESFDPLSLPDDSHIKFPERKEDKDSDYLIEVKKTKPGIVDTLELLKKTVLGYRVQIYATKDREQAYLLKDEATKIFNKDSINVYLVFNEPYYKIRIGDCKSREEANQLKNLARQRGYTNAWIVKSQVLEFPELMWRRKK